MHIDFALYCNVAASTHATSRNSTQQLCGKHATTTITLIGSTFGFNPLTHPTTFILSSAPLHSVCYTQIKLLPSLPRVVENSSDFLHGLDSMGKFAKEAYNIH
jgi:hypothetical protein